MKRNEMTTYWNRNQHWAPVSELRQEMDRIFDDFWRTPSLSRNAYENIWNPACDVEEGDHHYLLTLEVPGIAKDQIKIEVVDQQLLISGERKYESPDQDQKNFRYTERKYGSFQRSFSLPVGIDSEKLEATYQDGVLRIYVPKAESAKSRLIPIKEGSNRNFLEKMTNKSA